MSVTRTIATNFDSYVSQPRPGDNFGDERFLNVRNDSGETREAYLHFGLPDIQDSTIVSATIVLYLKSNWAGTNNVTAQRITQSWRERRITWRDRPNTTATNQGTATITGGFDGDALVIDVTAMVQQVANGASWFGVRLTNSNTSIRQLFSSEAVNSSKRPVLALEWASPPEAPTNLRPRGEQAISEAAPLLLWDSAQPFESQVQIDNASDFATPVYDTGFVANDETQYQTGTSLTDNTSYFWRVRIRDASGVASDWSETAEFDRRSKGTLTITSPAADNDDVETTTPDITHTFSGRTQKEVKYELRENGVVVYTKPRFTTTDTTFTLPSGLIRDADADYTITVQVWDTHNRQTIGDDTAYVEASRIFQFASDVTVDVPTGLAVVDERGHVTLTWAREGEPDYFALIVDGIVIFDRIEPSLILETTEAHSPGWGLEEWGDAPWGGILPTVTYSFDYFRAIPRKALTYQIQAVVETDGVLKHSDPSDPVIHTFRPVGIWLADEVDGTETVFLNREDVSSELGESGSTFYPLGRRDPVRVVDGIRGYEGVISGRMVEYDGDSAEIWRELLEDLKGRRAANLRLTYAYRNIPVQIGAMTIQPLPTGEEDYVASVEYSQIGEFSVEGV